ncbi:FAD-binding domain-containing protein [Whalleya microplaca]|nr:FAD-binding domain-containing protein [Whalleya microplaca]
MALSIIASVLNETCRYIPGDAGWPTSLTWQSLNHTVGGRLIATHPIAHVCHDPTYSETECANLRSQWDVPALMTTQPAEILHPWFQNQTCVPFTLKSTQCELGNYASYSINVSSVGDIVAGLAFSLKNNVRLVIKNSGHDYFGKSTGKGSLSLWTHNLSSQKFISNYTSSYYTGPALKAGAGVQGGAAAEFAAGHGYRVVVGTCPDVGFAGGFTQGGGHSLLTGLYGMGADNVLEWEVVLASGELVVATPTNNTDLYWALSGGGGGTYGVVVSLTVRLFEDGPIASASLSFGVATVGGVDEYWNTVGHFLSELQVLVDKNGIISVFEVTNTSLDVFALMAPGYTKSGLGKLLTNMISAIEHREAGKGKYVNSTLSVTLNEENSYLDLYSSTLEPVIAPNPLSPVMGGRFVSRHNVAKGTSNIVNALRATTEGGRFWLAITALNTNSAVKVIDAVADNAVSPNFDDAFLSMIVGASWDWSRNWDDAAILQDELSNRVMPTLEAATPGTGAYLNEASWQQSNWQSTFYGSNYDRLRQIKTANDPDNIFYAFTGVGSEAWSPDGNGRLCKTGL